MTNTEDKSSIEQNKPEQTEETIDKVPSKAETKLLPSNDQDFDQATDMLVDHLFVNESHKEGVKQINLNLQRLSKKHSPSKIMTPHCKLAGDEQKGLGPLQFHLTNLEDTQRKSAHKTEENQSNTVKSSSQFNFK